ncbi:MAG: hypothetical protein QNJ43_16960 [Breoghania sp.]|nr:hypothetical protein [Breoghania sp.]
MPAGSAIALKVETGWPQPQLALMVDGKGQSVTPQAARAAIPPSAGQASGAAGTGQATVAPQSAPQPAVLPPVLTSGDVFTVRARGQTGRPGSHPGNRR